MAILEPQALSAAYEICAWIALKVRTKAGRCFQMNFTPRATAGEAATQAAEKLGLHLGEPAFLLSTGKMLSSETRLVCLVNGDTVELVDLS